MLTIAEGRKTHTLETLSAWAHKRLKSRISHVPRYRGPVQTLTLGEGYARHGRERERERKRYVTTVYFNTGSRRSLFSFLGQGCFALRIYLEKHVMYHIYEDSSVTKLNLKPTSIY